MSTPSVFMKNSGWCWYQDPRAIIHNDQLVIGGVEGNGKGAAAVGVYDLKAGKILGRTVVHPAFDRDDHNSPVFHIRPDDSLLTVYARHGRDKLHRYRISEPDDYLSWSEEKTFDHAYPTAGNVTYMNLYHLSEEERLYNFFRGISFNPSFITSDDHGETWGNPTHLIASELKGRHRPYARYCSDGVATVHISFTDGHPRDFGNSIYYAAFRDGQFFRADGSRIKSLEKDGPLRPSEAERVFQGGGGDKRGNHLSAERAAWTAAIAVDADGRPHIGYTCYLSNTDNRYRLASWDGKKWVDREVARGGQCLYDREASYTGLITLDPMNPKRVVIATDVHPTTGEDVSGTHEVYQTTIATDDDISSLSWKPLTANSPEGVRNIRPMVLHTDSYRIILWQRGSFKTYTHYELDTVGLVETK